MGNMKIEQASPHREKKYLFPDEDISGCTNWFPSSGSKDYLMVTEYTATREESPWQFDFDNHIQWQSQSSGTELFKFTDLSLSTSDVINYVKVNAYARCYPDAEGEDEEYYLIASPSAACTDIYASDDKDLTTGWKKQSYIWTQNPATSSAWTPATVNAAAFGIKGKGELGVFTFEDRDDVGGTCYDVHVCTGTGRICVLSSVSVLIYLITTSDEYVLVASEPLVNGTGIWAEQARQSGTVGEMYIYCSCGTDGLKMYYYDGSSTITHLDTIDDGGTYKAIHGWSYNDIHFLADGVDTSFTKIAVAVGTNGLYLYNTTSDDYYIPTASRLELNDTINDSGGDSYEDVFIEDWKKTGYSYLKMHASCDDTGGTGSHIRGYTWTPTVELVANGVHNTAAHPHGIKARKSSNPLYDSEVFVATTTGGILAIGKDNSGGGSYTQLDFDDQGGDYRDVAIDPTTTYIYVGVYAAAGVYHGVYQYEFIDNKFYYITKVSYPATSWGNSEAVDVTGIYVVSAEYGWGTRLYKTTNTQRLYMSEMWLEIDYTISTTTCYLTMPEELSSNHKRNIRMLNFWNGEREVYGLNRSGKSLVLNGTEYYRFRDNPTPCARINCIRDMARRGDEITLSDLSPTYFNGNYYIRQFGWTKVSSAPTVFQWILSLEDAEK